MTISAARAGRLSGLALASLLAITSISALATGPVFGQSIVRMGQGASANVSVARGKTRTVQAAAPVAEIVVGDPEIAAVQPLSDNSFYIRGASLGTTAIALFDANRSLVGSIDVEVTLDTDQISGAIRSGGGTGIKVRAANGAVVLSGNARSAVEAERAKSIAEQYAGNGVVINSVNIDTAQQVQLNVRFVEINRNLGRELGTRIRAVYASGGGSLSFNAAPQTTTGNTPGSSLIGSLLSNGVSIDAAITALEQRGVARRLAEPNLVDRSGETASFLAGGEFPIPVSEAEGKVTVEYKKFGVGLNFTPIVLDDGLISLDIEPEVSSVDPTSSYSVGNIAIPGFTVRRARTSVDLRSGQSFMVAGLLQNENTVTANQVPGLSKLPIIGALFTSKAYQRRETDLVIIITPHLVQPMDVTAKASVPTDASVPATDVEYFLGDIAEKPANKALGGQHTSPYTTVQAGGTAVKMSMPSVPPPSHGHYLEAN